MDKVYYIVDNGVLYLDGEKVYLNRIGVGVNY